MTCTLEAMDRIHDSLDNELLEAKQEVKKVKSRHKKSSAKLQDKIHEIELLTNQIKLKEVTYHTFYILQKQEINQNHFEHEEKATKIEELIKGLNEKIK